MGRRKASEHGLSPGIWVRLPLADNFAVRQLVTANRPLGVVLRELILRGLALEGKKGAPAREPPLSA